MKNPNTQEAQREIEVTLRSAAYTDWPVPVTGRSRRTVGGVRILPAPTGTGLSR